MSKLRLVALSSILFYIVINTSVVHAQNNAPYKLTFEDAQDLKHINAGKGSELSLSHKHHKFGLSSLKWQWSNKGELETSYFSHLSEEDSPLAYGDYFPNSPTTILSIYSEKKQKGKIRVSFASDSNDEVWFDIPLNFTGWRTVWVPFYEMNGNTPRKNQSVKYQRFKMHAESDEGEVYIDDLVFSQYQDDRYSYPDFLVPFIKKDFAPEQDHWMPSMQYYEYINQLSTDLNFEYTAKEIERIEERITNRFTDSISNSDTRKKAKEAYEKLNLKVGKTVNGRPLTFRNQETYFKNTPKYDEDYMEVHRFGDILKELAQLYLSGDQESKIVIKKYFITATRYFLDQGWQAGSSGGTRHHIGYSLEDIAEAFFIMRDPLLEAGLLNQVGESMQWVFNLGKILAPDEDFTANIDYFNTQSFYHLMIIYMREDYKEIAALLNAYSKYISITLAQNDERGVFKVDGTSWHHGGHYPAYGMGAFKNLPKVIRTLSGTSFRIGTQGHSNFKKALLTTRLYSNLYDFGFANAGRHPLENNSIEFLKPQFLDMIYSGNPEHTSPIDHDFAGAYLRLWGEQDSITSSALTTQYNIHKEKLPGYHVMPYAATAIHRRNDWAAIIKGYSKYVWSSEIYIASNRYGRYPSNGTIQLLSKKGEKASGFNQNGWDWNRYPGATEIYLPLKKLDADMSLLMFKSQQTFAGAVKQDNNGVFAMILDESSGSNADGQRIDYGYPGKLKAHKSVFSFGDRLICIGTGISSIDKQNPVETVLFQNYLTHPDREVFITGQGTLQNFPIAIEKNKKEAKDLWILDAHNNAYHVLSNTGVQLKKQKQKSYHNKYAINSGKMNSKGKGAKITEGDYAVAWLEHGKAPNDASYQYVIYPEVSGRTLTSIKEGSYKDEDFQIIQADNKAHIVHDTDKNIWGFVVFDPEEKIKHPILNTVSDPAIVMLRTDKKDAYTLSVVQPDLNFINPEGKKTTGYSYPVNLKLTLQGRWEVKEVPIIKDVQIRNGITSINIEARHGFTNNIVFVKKN